MSSPFLSNLGISLPTQSFMPTVQAFPAKFNPAGASLWTIVIQGLEEGLDPLAAWTTCIEIYVDLCQRQGVHPFKAVDQANDALVSHLQTCHEALVSALDAVSHPIKDEYSVLEITRQAHVDVTGFEISVQALFKNSDPTFDQHLVQQGFGPVNTKFVKRVNQSVFLCFERANQANRWEVSYTVSGPMLPVLPDLLATKDQLERFLYNSLWRKRVCKESNPEHQGPKFI